MGREHARAETVCTYVLYCISYIVWITVGIADVCTQYKRGKVYTRDRPVRTYVRPNSTRRILRATGKTKTTKFTYGQPEHTGKPRHRILRLRANRKRPTGLIHSSFHHLYCVFSESHTENTSKSRSRAHDFFFSCADALQKILTHAVNGSLISPLHISS
jgi:hypothetical protein